MSLPQLLLAYFWSEEEDIDGDYGQFVTNLRRKRQQVIAWHVVETSLRAKTEHRQKSGPQGPKKNISDPAFNWERHVDKLTRGAFRRRYRMDVSSFDKLLDKIRPHLSRKDEGMAKRNRKAGAVSDEVTLAITLRYLAGSMRGDKKLLRVEGDGHLRLRPAIHVVRHQLREPNTRLESLQGYAIGEAYL